MRDSRKDITRGPVISVQFQMDGGFSGVWNTILASDLGRDLFVPPRALDDAVFALNNLHDPRPYWRLKEIRTERADMIRRHFAVCAKKLIEQIEHREGWQELEERVAARHRPAETAPPDQ